MTTRTAPPRGISQDTDQVSPGRVYAHLAGTLLEDLAARRASARTFTISQADLVKVGTLGEAVVADRETGEVVILRVASCGLLCNCALDYWPAAEVASIPPATRTEE